MQSGNPFSYRGSLIFSGYHLYRTDINSILPDRRNKPGSTVDQRTESSLISIAATDDRLKDISKGVLQTARQYSLTRPTDHADALLCYRITGVLGCMITLGSRHPICLV
jgi:hypothetical protein